MMAPSHSLSVVIPAYNEAIRLPPYLLSIREYLERTLAGNYEVVVVDDGSQDGLSDLLEKRRVEWPQLCLHRHRANRGKGAAVRTGMLAARGTFLLFADADGATPIEEEQLLRAALAGGADLAIGSRLLDDGAFKRSKRLLSRDLAGRSFAWLVRQFLGLPLRDTQCGFKMFRREAGQTLFRLCREPGYLFDLEVLIRAQQLGFRTAEVPVRWRDVPGSKVRLLRDGWKMARGLWTLWRDRRESSLPAATTPPGPLHFPVYTRLADPFPNNGDFPISSPLGVPNARTPGTPPTHPPGDTAARR
jgi:dolichyl-phosphate beta-glucosyltransferase